MRLPIRQLLILMVAFVAVACGSGAPTASPTPASSLAPGPSVELDAAWLRASTTQAIPPVDQFAVPDTAAITHDGRYVTAGPVGEMYPGPLLPNLRERTITDDGRQRILDEASPARPPRRPDRLHGPRHPGRRHRASRAHGRWAPGDAHR